MIIVIFGNNFETLWIHVQTWLKYKTYLLTVSWYQVFNSMRPSDAYIRQYTMPPLVQLMACGLVGAEPLSEPMLIYCLLAPQE